MSSIICCAPCSCFRLNNLQLDMELLVGEGGLDFRTASQSYLREAKSYAATRQKLVASELCLKPAVTRVELLRPTWFWAGPDRRCQAHPRLSYSRGPPCTSAP